MDVTRPVVIFGAGATKACGGPLTNEILFNAFASSRNAPPPHSLLDELNAFLVREFNVPAAREGRCREDYPPLPLLLSLIDTAIDRHEPLTSSTSVDALVRSRSALEFAIFAVLEQALLRGAAAPYGHLFDLVAMELEEPPAVISLNYDVLADRALMALAHHYGLGAFADYGCDIATEAYQKTHGTYPLLKLHGSVNWRYCPGCHRLDVGVSQGTEQSIREVSHLFHNAALRLENWYSQPDTPCSECRAILRAVMIAPTSKKDYRNPHIASIWYRAQRLLQNADRVIFAGYSLPEDDVDVIYLLKRGLSRLAPEQITVIEYDDQNRDLGQHPVGQRFRSLFGPSIEWTTAGFAGWLREYDWADRSLLTREPVKKGRRIWAKPRKPARR